jgi:hypothetical protein
MFSQPVRHRRDTSLKGVVDTSDALSQRSEVSPSWRALSFPPFAEISAFKSTSKDSRLLIMTSSLAIVILRTNHSFPQPNGQKFAGQKYEIEILVSGVKPNPSGTLLTTTHARRSVVMARP